MRGMKKISGLFFLLFLVFCNTAFAECIQGNCINGQGTYTYASGSKYVGEFKDDFPHGQGTYTYASGNKYVGEWELGKYHGQGTFTWANGGKYVGEWKDDKKHGQGTLTKSDGKTVQSIFEDGELIEEQ